MMNQPRCEFDEEDEREGERRESLICFERKGMSRRAEEKRNRKRERKK